MAVSVSVPSVSLSLSLSLSLLLVATCFTTGCDSPPSTLGENAAKSRAALTGQVDTRSFPLDNPAIVALSEDGKTFTAPLSASGDFKVSVEGDASYRLMLVNAIGPGLYYAISHVQWHDEAGFSAWGHCEGGGSISLGTIKPMTKDEASACPGCTGAGAAGSALADIWGQAAGCGGGGGGAEGEEHGGILGSLLGSAQGSASFSIGGSAQGNAQGSAGGGVDGAGGGGGGFLSSLFGFAEQGGASFNISGSVSGSAQVSAEGSAWGWIGGGAWCGAWGSAGSTGGGGAAAGFGSGDWKVCDELDATERLNFSTSSDVISGIEGSATASGAADADAKLRSQCGSSAYQQKPQVSAQPVPVGGSCSFNAQCGSSAFCASSVCVAADATVK